MAGNKNLGAAKNAKKDEFYTQLADIANELKHYRKHFEGKVVLCNCDDPYESNFFKFFASKFNSWGLKKLICTCYNGSSVAGTDLFFDDFQPERNAYKIELTEVKDLNGDGAIDLEDVKLLLEQNPPQLLRGNGDFRSSECIEFLKEADIVVTNPPFSLFREYVAQLVEYDKKFLIIGSVNAITYKEIFPLIRDNKLWLGYGFQNGNAYFAIPNYEDTFVKGVYNAETGLVKFRNCHWFTNLEHKKRHEPIDLFIKYSESDFPHYENYDAIQISKTAEIPLDYNEKMGVPITFLDKYCPEQFEIIGLAHGNLGASLGIKPYPRELKKINKGLRDGDLYYMENGIPKIPYPRIIIRKKQN